jgi:glycosyltransferase involved in cell wall biosynthesis
MDAETLVSIVTPSFNSASFIERTIESVLSQDYPRIEYIVMDGGSSDGTQEILEKYKGTLTYVSERDAGAADAINRGFRLSSGRFFAWLNADDTYLSGAVGAALRRLTATPQASVVYGEGIWTDEHDAVLGAYPTAAHCDRTSLEKECCICQPATLIRRDAFEAVGGLDPALHFAFDYDLWIRLSRKHLFSHLPERLATSRMHRTNKSLGQRRLVFEENIEILRRHFGYVPVNWVYGYLSFLRDGRDQYFEPLRHSPPVYLGALAAGSYYNYRHLWRYWMEWGSRIKRKYP